jgi:ParB-like chromosome segregation protein Spo0J
MSEQKTQSYQIEQVDIQKLIPYANNAKLHSDDQVAQIAASIRAFGFNNPVLIDQQNGIIAGHGRVLAARKLDLTEVPCIRLTHLSDAQRRAYILADNRLAETGGGWEWELVKLEVDQLAADGIEIDLIGFTEADIDRMLVTGREDDAPDDFPEANEDIKTEHQCPKCGYAWSGKSK